MKTGNKQTAAYIKAPSNSTLLIILLAVVVFSFGISTAALADSIPKVYINGERFITNPPAWTSDEGRTYVPLRAVCEKLGFTCSWDAATAILSDGRNLIKIAVGKAYIEKNGEKIYYDVCPTEYLGRVMIPLRMAGEAMNAFVEYIPSQNSVTVNSSGAASNPSAYLIPDAGTLAGFTVIIDAGHGLIQQGGQWTDPGAVGKNGLCERDVVLEVANIAAAQLRALGAKVITTRNSNATTLTISQRAAFAATHKADVFVSVHANANTNRNITGSSVYINSSSYFCREDARLAGIIQRHQVSELQTRDAGIYAGAFGVLRNLACPGVIAEIAFISNADEEKLLATAAFQNSAATAIANGISEFLLSH